MNEELQSLKEAYSQSTDNITLLMLLVRNLDKANQIEEALDYLKNYANELSKAEDRILAGNIALKSRNPELAIKYCNGDDSQELMIQARAYLALKEHKKGLEIYNKAILNNSALEDLELRNLLNQIDIMKESDEVVIEFLLANNSSTQIKKNDAGENENDESPVIISPGKSQITFKDIGGLLEVKQQIHRKIILPFSKPSLFARFKKKSGGGVLLYGPPGCGKTLLALATAGECNANFYNVAVSDVLDRWFGESEKKLHAIFEYARRTAPSVLFFDEVEALAGKRSVDDSSASRVVSQFLSELDGFAHNNQGVLILAATNVPWSIDSAFRRPGRFDRMQLISPPDKEARRAILELLLTDLPLANDINLEYLAKATAWFSGADLSNLVESACDIAIENSIDEGVEKPLSMNFLKKALKEVKPTTQEWLTTARNFAKYSNESGQYDDILAFLEQHAK